jgi:hypothetical protein
MAIRSSWNLTRKAYHTNCRFSVVLKDLENKKKTLEIFVHGCYFTIVAKVHIAV